MKGQAGPARARLYAQNERHLDATFGERFKIVSTPEGEGRRLALYDRASDPGERKDVAKTAPDALRAERRELELFLERADREWNRTKPLLGEGKGEPKATGAACEQLKALGYVSECAP
jgi:hypothetical protein